MTLFLGALLVFALGLLFTALMNLWIGVPSLPTPMPIVRTMIGLAELEGNETVMDLGAGDGRLLIEAKKKFPGISATGWEIIPTIWFLGMFRKTVRRQKVTLLLGNALKADVSKADVVFLYLFPFLLEKLETRFNRELRPGTRVISHTFIFPGKAPVTQKKVRGYWGETSVFLYVW